MICCVCYDNHTMNEEIIVNNYRIFTEEPEQELWRSLLQFSYKANIQRYFEEHQISTNSSDEKGTEKLDNLTNCIAGALLQANEYYKASRNVSLQVEPVLLYYGTTNLLYAMSALLNGVIPQISNHGMYIKANGGERSYIADTSIRFDHPSNGGIHIFAKDLGFQLNLCEYRPWCLGDFFDSIAEINSDFERCYQGRKSHILLLDVVKIPEGMVEKVYLTEGNVSETFNNIEGFNASYLRPQEAHDRYGNEYIVLRHKINGKSIHQISYSGQPYLQEAHKKNGKLITVTKALNMYISLFALGSLCRYHPTIWNPFVTQDSTGEKLLIEKLLYYSRRILPNIVLDRLMNKQITFVSDKYVPEDRIHLVGEHEVREIVSNEVRTQIKDELAHTVIRIKRG